MSDLHAAMSKAFAELGAAIKDKSNPHFKSKYADLGAVIDAVKPTLAKHGLFFWQVSHDVPEGACIETVIGHSSGGERSLGKLYIPASKRDAHGFGSAITYARRYALQTAFGIPAEDDDGHAATGGGQSQTGAVSPRLITAEQLAELQQLADEAKPDLEAFCTFYKIGSLPELPADQFAHARAALQAKIKKAKAA